jgi:hypothetical protein
VADTLWGMAAKVTFAQGTHDRVELVEKRSVQTNGKGEVGSSLSQA